MKSTKIMLAVIATLLITWMSLGFIFYIFSDMTFKESCCNPGVGSIMLFIGWVPSVVVAIDLDDHI